MKFGKILLSVALVFFIVVGVGIWYVLSNVNSLVKDAIETVGSEVLQTDVRVDSVDIRFIDGSGALSGFSIKNYPGFTQENLLSFDNIKLDIDPSSVQNEVVVIDELTLSGISIVAEQRGSKTNLQTLLDKLPKSDDSKNEEGADSTSQEILLAVRKLNFVDNSLTLATEKYGSHSLNLPKIVQTNLGSETAGLTPTQLAERIARPLIEQAKKSVEKNIEKLAKEKVKEKLDSKVDEQTQRLKDKVNEKLGDGAAEKLKGLFGK